MTQKYMNNSSFAKLAGVNPSTVTRLRSTVLKRAKSGKGIDAAHKDAVAYLKKRERNQTAQAATGLDLLYEPIVKWCQENNRYSVTGIQKEFSIGYTRATRIVKVMNVNGIVPAKQIKKIKSVAPPPPPLKVVETKKPIGQAKVHEDKKTEPFVPNVQIPEDIDHLAEWTVREVFNKFGTEGRFIDFLNAIKNIEAIKEKQLKNAATKGELINRQLVKTGVIDVFNSAHLRLLKDGAKTISVGVVSKHAGGANLMEIEAYVSDILGSFIKPAKHQTARILKEVV